MAVKPQRQPWLRAGYTLVELLTVVAITSILSLAAVQILLQGQLRSSQAEAITKLRQEGYFVLDRITHELRNGLDAECPATNQLVVTTVDGQDITFWQNGTAIASDSSLLTTEDVTVQSVMFVCQDSTNTSGTLVKVNLSLTTPELLQTTPDFAQDFATSVYVRTVN